jgi:hypothetical protein
MTENCLQLRAAFGGSGGRLGANTILQLQLLIKEGVAMAKTSEDKSSWDKIEAAEGFQEQIGSQRYEDNGAAASTDDPTMITMPDESLAADDLNAFGEQLPMTDDDTMIISEELAGLAEEPAAAAPEQLDAEDKTD